MWKIEGESMDKPKSAMWLVVGLVTGLFVGSIVAVVRADSDRQRDTDGDGVPDALDAFPLDHDHHAILFSLPFNVNPLGAVVPLQPAAAKDVRITRTDTGGGNADVHLAYVCGDPFFGGFNGNPFTGPNPRFLQEEVHFVGPTAPFIVPYKAGVLTAAGEWCDNSPLRVVFGLGALSATFLLEVLA